MNEGQCYFGRASKSFPSILLRYLLIKTQLPASREPISNSAGHCKGYDDEQASLGYDVFESGHQFTEIGVPSFSFASRETELNGIPAVTLKKHDKRIIRCC